MRPEHPEFSEFVEAMSPRLVGAVLVVTGDRAASEDLAQEALARAWQHWSDVSTMHDRSAWVYRVALNLAASRWRRVQAGRRAGRRHGPMPTQLDLADTADAIAVRAAVAELPPKQRAVVACRFYLGLTVAETSEVVGCAPGTVKAHTHQAIAALRRLDLGHEPVDPQEAPSE